MLSNPPLENNSDDNIMVNTIVSSGLYFVRKNCELHQLSWSFICEDVGDKFYEVGHFDLLAELDGACLRVKREKLQCKGTVERVVELSGIFQWVF